MKRLTKQFLIPEKKVSHESRAYDLYPSHHLPEGEIAVGYSTLAEKLLGEPVLILDGYIGVDWEEVSSELVRIFKEMGKTVRAIDIREYFKSENRIQKMIEPFLGGDDPLFGTRTTLGLSDYIDEHKIDAIQLDDRADINLIYGTGASRSKIDGFLVYFDLPKNELQYRMRAGAITNLGFSAPKDAGQMYKHFYFVDWVVLNKEKRALLPKIGIMVDQQRPDNPTWASGRTLRNALSKMSKSFFRARPWFQPGVWGGQWMKEKFPGLNLEDPNLAWSIELISPENGLLFESSGNLLEISFDTIMYQEMENILGKAVNRFQHEFPIRFNFLDTYDGGNLSIQCHPGPEYAKEQFGENFTQDETYYILDCEEGAEVYLGFQEGIDPDGFKKALESSFETKEILDIDKYVQKFPAEKHDLYLIPHGTVHCSGINNMVLEISATPYLFTFKMYDWQRLDLNGRPRPLNIEHAFKNLNFESQGGMVMQTLKSKPLEVSSGANWKKIHLPTHPLHFYDIYRYEFAESVTIETMGQCHIMMLVEGNSMVLSVDDTGSGTFNYAETIVVPAAARSYKLTNSGGEIAKVVVCFVKEEAC